MNYSRVLHPNDYNLFEGHKLIDGTRSKLASQYRFEHEHRKWEYGLTHDFLKEQKAITVLDVGGGGSVLSPMLAVAGFDVTQTDINSAQPETDKQNQFLNINMRFIQEDFSKEDVDLGMFDAVISVSTIEHVSNHVPFFINLLKHAKKAVFLTTDFSEHATVFSPAHLRTYNGKELNKYIEIAKDYGFVTQQEPEYAYRGNFVYSYTFGSLSLVRKEK